MRRPTYSPFQGGPFKRVAKVVALCAFGYAVAMAIALEKKDTMTVAIGCISFVVLGVISLAESFRYWNDLKKWSADEREKKA